MARRLTNDIYDHDKVEQAKLAVIELTKNTAPTNTVDLFFSDNLEEIENGIKKLNEFSSKCWILSAIALYILIYDKQYYTQSGLSWQDYERESKKRLGLEQREFSEQLSGARFFISHQVRLINKGWDTTVPNQSLARGQLAYELSGDLDGTIEHMVHDTQKGFKEWYQSFKALPVTDDIDVRPDVKIENHRVMIDDEDIVSFSDKLPESDKEKLELYIEQIYNAIKKGDYPAIVPVYDEKEARQLINLRDKNRAKK